MTSASDPVSEPKDRTKLIWLGVLALIALLVIALFVGHRARRFSQSVVRARHILITFDGSSPVARSDAYELIDGLRQRILDGERFDKLARDYSNDEFSRVRGGDLGWYKRGKLAPQIEQYIWTAPIGQLSEIITTSYGFHLVEVMDRYITDADQYERQIEKDVVVEEAPAQAPDATDAPVPPAP